MKEIRKITLIQSGFCEGVVTSDFPQGATTTDPQFYQILNLGVTSPRPVVCLYLRFRREVPNTDNTEGAPVVPIYDCNAPQLVGKPPIQCFRYPIVVNPPNQELNEPPRIELEAQNSPPTKYETRYGTITYIYNSRGSKIETETGLSVDIGELQWFILNLLLKNIGETVTNNSIIAALEKKYPKKKFSLGSIKQNIFYIRTLFEELGMPKETIRTIDGRSKIPIDQRGFTIDLAKKEELEQGDQEN